MGMPVKEFVDKAYAGLVSGDDHVIIGSVGPEDVFLDIAHKRRQQFDNLSRMMLQYFELRFGQRADVITLLTRL